MAKTQQPDPAQLTFAVFSPPVIVPNGDGFTIKPGKPILTLSPKQLGQQFGVSRRTVYLWIDVGIVPEEFVRYAGQRKLAINAAVVPILEAKFKDKHNS